MLIHIKKVSKNRRMDRNEVHDDCIQTEDIRSIKRWNPNKREQAELRTSKEMTQVFMKGSSDKKSDDSEEEEEDRKRETGKIKIYESFESFTHRAGAIPYEDGAAKEAE